MHERISANGLCFPTAGFAALADHWQALGARRVSFVSLLLDAEDREAAEAALQSGNYPLETIVHPFMPGQPLERNEQSWREPRARLTAVLETAAALGGRSVYMTTGGHGSGTWEESAEAFAEAVAPCAELAGKLGLELMIENAPFVYADLHIAHSLRDTVTLAEMANIGVCIDIFSCWTEAGLRETIERAMPRCHLVQVSDHVPGDRALPSRAVPGDGAIPLQRILDWILNAGYQGAFDLELLGPRIDREGHFEATRRTADNLGKILESLGT